MGKPGSMQIPALLGNDPGELPEGGLLPDPPQPPQVPHLTPGALTSRGPTLSLLAVRSQRRVNPAGGTA